MKRTPLRRDTAKARAFADSRGKSLARSARRPLRRTRGRRRKDQQRQLRRHVKQYGVAYRMYIQALPCAAKCPRLYASVFDIRYTVSTIGADRLLSASGQVEAAHVVKSRGAGGRPWHMIPLSPRAHRAQHDLGVDTFAARIEEAKGVSFRPSFIARTLATETFLGRTCLSIDRRILKALTLTVERQQDAAFSPSWHVTGGDNPDGYRVTFHRDAPHRCGCDDHNAPQRHQRTCKHQVAVRLSLGETLESIAADMIQHECFEVPEERAAQRSARAPVTRAQVRDEMDAIFGPEGEERIGRAEPMGRPEDVLARDAERRDAAARWAAEYRRQRRERRGEAEYTGPRVMR
jgi:hypothetical protein